MRLSPVVPGGLIAVLFGVMLGGCNLTSRLPRIKIEPPPAAETALPTPAAEPPTEPEVSAEEVDRTVAEATAEPEEGTSSATPQPYVPLGSTRALTAGDLQGKTAGQLDILRNEIYAAHGRKFQRQDLRQYFERKTWYVPDAGYSDSRLSKLEARNVDFIASYQRRQKQTTGKPSRSSGGSGSQIIPASSSRQLTASDLAGMSKWELDVARNEIYARHGRRFNRSDLQRHFNSQSWYQADSGFSESRLSAVEKRNAEFIRKYQTAR